MLFNLLPALVLEAIDEAAVAIDHGLEQKICRVAQIRKIINFRGSGRVSSFNTRHNGKNITCSFVHCGVTF